MNNQDLMKLNRAIEELKNNNDIFAEDMNAKIREAMNDQFDEMKVKLGDRCDQHQMLVELRVMQAQLAEVLDLTKDSRANLIEGLEITEVNQRTCPTLFIILPSALEVKSESLEETGASFESAVERAREFTAS